MHVPICGYETFATEYVDQYGRRQWDAVAMIRPCGHVHRYTEFEETLNRLFPDLHLGFDRKNERWCIYRWSTAIEKVEAGPSLSITHNRRYLDVVLACMVQVETRTKEGGRRMKYLPRDYGDWVLEELARFDPRRMTPDSSWVDEYLDQKVNEDDVRSEQKIQREAEDWVADAMTLADRGNPLFLRKQFRQRKTVREAVAEAKT